MMENCCSREAALQVEALYMRDDICKVGMVAEVTKMWVQAM